MTKPKSTKKAAVSKVAAKRPASKTDKSVNSKRTIKKPIINHNKPLVKRVGAALARSVQNVTQPIRSHRLWKFLRRHILRSPFGGYFIGAWKEVRQVSWPDRRTSIRLTIVVALFSVCFALLITTIDYGFENLAKRLFLN